MSEFPRIAAVGLGGVLVRFADHLSEPANRAALAFRRTVEDAAWDGVAECATSLASTFLRFDPLVVEFDDLAARLNALLASCDWYDVPLPTGRRRFNVPCVFGGDHGPQFGAAADASGLDHAAALAALCAPLRVMTIGFAPGLPYMGALPDFDIARLSDLVSVPAGGVAVAIGQAIIFPNPSPTGWRHVGQSALRPFQPGAAQPFLLNAGDEVQFRAAAPDELQAISDAADPMGGAEVTAI